MCELSTTIQTTIQTIQTIQTTRERERARAHFITERGERQSKKSNSYTFSTRKRDGEKDAYPTTATERCQSAEEPAAASVGG